MIIITFPIFCFMKTNTAKEFRQSPSLVVISGIVMLLAGLSVMGAAQDALDGYYVTAGARGLEVMMMTLGIAVGVAVVIGIGRTLGVSMEASAVVALGGSPLVSTLGAMLMGLVTGLLAGGRGSWLDVVLTRLSDALLAFPGFLLVLLVVVILGNGQLQTIAALAVGGTPVFFRLTRGYTRSILGRSAKLSPPFTTTPGARRSASSRNCARCSCASRSVISVFSLSNALDSSAESWRFSLAALSARARASATLAARASRISLMRIRCNSGLENGIPGVPFTCT